MPQSSKKKREDFRSDDRLIKRSKESLINCSHTPNRIIEDIYIFFIYFVHVKAVTLANAGKRQLADVLMLGKVTSVS